MACLRTSSCLHTSYLPACLPACPPPPPLLRVAQVVGASGGVSGLVGLFLADMLLNFETIPRPILRSLAALCLLAYFAYASLSSPSTSHISHAGGLICGLLPSFLILPNLKSERWEAVLPLLGGASILVWFVVLPVWLYRVRFEGLVASGRCPA